MALMRRRFGALIFTFVGATLMTSLAVAKDSTVKITYVDAAIARQALADTPNMKVLDVRTKAEFKRGHIEGALRNNYFSMKFKRRLRLLDRDTPYLVHCKSGHRSERVVKIMLKEGFTQITHMDGGYDAWKKLPLPTIAKPNPKTD